MSPTAQTFTTCSCIRCGCVPVFHMSPTDPMLASLRFKALAATLLALFMALLAPQLAQAAQTDFFPLVVEGKRIDIRTTTSRKALMAALKAALAPEQPSVATFERLQYDFIAVEGEGPLTLWFDFDKAGRLTHLGVASTTKKQNPVAQTLVSWLEKNAGPGLRRGKAATWSLAGFAFVRKEVKNAGEDSYYGVEASRQ